MFRTMWRMSARRAPGKPTSGRGRPQGAEVGPTSATKSYGMNTESMKIERQGK